MDVHVTVATGVGKDLYVTVATREKWKTSTLRDQYLKVIAIHYIIGLKILFLPLMLTLDMFVKLRTYTLP